MAAENEFVTTEDVETVLPGTSLTNGLNTFHIICQDYNDNEMSDSALIIFTYDTEAPSSSVAALPEYSSSDEIELTWSGSDTFSGIESYELQVSTDLESWDSVDDFDADTLSYTEEELDDGTYYYRTIATDNAGNEESKSTYDTKITIDFDEPDSLSVSINNGDTYTNSVSVTLSLSASDDNLDSVRCRFSNDGEEWSAYEDYAAVKTWVLETGDDTKTVYYECEDGAENTAESTTDTIILDETAPQITKTQPNDTISDSTPELRITTDSEADCEFNQDAEFEYGTEEGFSFESEDNFLHEYDDLDLPLDREYLFYVKCVDDAGNMDETTMTLNLDTRELFTIVRPDIIYGYFLPGFRQFTLSQDVLDESTTLEDYAVENVLESLDQNYEALYYRVNDSVGGLLVHIPEWNEGGGGKLDEFIDQTGYIPYYIRMTSKDRIEIE